MRPRGDEARQERCRIVAMLRNIHLYLSLGQAGGHVRNDIANEEREALLCEFVSLQQVIPTLPLEERRVIALIGLIGLSQTETADRLGISESAVRKRLAAAARRIQAQWQGG